MKNKLIEFLKKCVKESNERNDVSVICLSVEDAKEIIKLLEEI